VAENPFERREVVSGYEAWYATRWGALVDRLERRLLRELLEPLAPGARVVEIGCGTGHFAAALAADGFEVVGIDPSERMLEVARSRVPVARADGARLPFRDGAFDGAVLVSVLDFVEDPLRVLLEARRVARRRVVLLALTSGSWLGLRRRVAGRLGHPIFSAARFLSRRRLVALAREACGEPERVRAALLLPPALGARLAGLEERLARGAPPLAGVLGLALRGGGP
jgi:SAM-dependent methyltransferase